MSFMKASVGFGKIAAFYVHDTEIVKSLNIDRVKLQNSLVAL